MPKIIASSATVVVRSRAKRYLIAAVAMSPDVWEDVTSVNSVGFGRCNSGDSMASLRGGV